jgi:hypothetical protein
VTSKLRAVFDTSVVVSAVLLPRSVPRQAFDRVQEQGKALISVATVDERNEVLRRQYFDKYVRETQRLEFLATLIREAELVDVTEVVTECRDPTICRTHQDLAEIQLWGRPFCVETRRSASLRGGNTVSWCVFHIV